MHALALSWIPGCLLLSFISAQHVVDPDVAFPGSFERWYGESLNAADGAHLHVEGNLPAWLIGDMFNAGPSQQRIANQEFMHIFDGFARINKYSFNGTITFSSKMLLTKWYNKSISEGHVAPGVLMAETKPARPLSHIPFVNVEAPNDNVYVLPWRIGHEYLYMTDGPTRLRFNPDTLNIEEESTSGDFTGNAVPEGMMCTTGAAHVVPDPRFPNDGSYIGFLGCAPKPPKKGTNAMVLYSVSANDTKKQNMIAQINVPQFSYCHSFSVTKNFLVVIAEPYYIDAMKLVMGKTVSDAYYTNLTSVPTTFYVVNIATGKVQALESPGFVFIHTLNAFERDNETIVLDVCGVSQTEGYLGGGLKSLMFNKTVRDSKSPTFLMRYTLHLQSGKVDVQQLVPQQPATLAVPRFNENLRGVETCIVYGSALYYNSTSFSSSAAIKLDVCQGLEVGRFYKPGHFNSEIIFVARPGGVDEDDGVLLGVVYDGGSQQSYLHVLDARTMEPIAKAYLPFMLPFLIHSNFFEPMGT